MIPSMSGCSLLCLGHENCIQKDTTILGYDLIQGIKCASSTQAECVAECHKKCVLHPKCLAYSYLTEKFTPVGYKKSCYLKDKSVEEKSSNGNYVVSGPKFCFVEMQ